MFYFPDNYLVLCYSSCFLLYSHYGYSISNEKLNGHQASKSLGFLGALHLPKFLKALPLYMMLSSISDKDVLYIFSANKVAAEEVPQ